MLTSTTTLNAAIHNTNAQPEVSPTWLAAHLGEVDLIDVREAHELQGPLGAIENARNIPLGDVLDADLDLDTPTVLICRSGRRSALAAEALVRQGMKAVASVEGGMLAWNDEVLHHADIHSYEKQANAKNLNEAIYTINGLPEVSAGWVSNNLGLFRLIDVRSPGELTANGRVLQSENVVLDQLMRTAEGWQRDQPIVVMCHSGGRSGRAAVALIRAGFTNIASLEGGIMGWRASRLPIA